jgi:hypothetical protein
MKEITKEALQVIFEGCPRKLYKKRGHYLFRPAIGGETVLTVVAGKLETFKRSNPGDIVLRNIEIGSSAETYMVPDTTFYKRYNLLSSKGRVSWEELKKKSDSAGCDHMMAWVDMAGLSHWVDGQKWYEAEAVGQVEAFPYVGEPIQFQAPWSELMMCVEGDFIARPVPGDVGDIYRIEKDTFYLTYKEVV